MNWPFNARFDGLLFFSLWTWKNFRILGKDDFSYNPFEFPFLVICKKRSTGNHMITLSLSGKA
jgi:hypothetical protein